ncbi:hypothetical protein H9Q69_011990 [Fusarium xylarioides]|uniref:Uncharacterized protein n=1 Tax=Fusarium xylarioides TaxID=221167 RepID=A0A9P7I5S4_9HYPO|nr:hypothetical protein H9Q70_013185 [Fusarium xylarioides]KAG5758871.1 hypothetical protein H9Q72_013004 [Fusarium xylarioides]KAG5770943.1 hypothetical protein H9Q73_013024 [Fusarium xylarioides]KAG5788950.1 hypothetical protein H9Q69_011990 [Fusarium xylarioides]KAG5801426.1 hypothetical protein H9Q71_013989 [Fusarium xylarioides]
MPQDVYVRFANGLGEGQQLNITVYYQMNGSNTVYQKHISLNGPGYEVVHLNYIQKVVKGGLTANVGLNSSAFDGQPDAAYFTTRMSDASDGRHYRLEWESGGVSREKWYYQ